MAAWQDPKTFAIWLAIFIAVVLLLSVSIVAFTRLYFKRLLLAQSKLTQAKVDYQKQLVQDSIAIQEQERERVALELHDNLISKLNVVSFALQTGNKSLDTGSLLTNCIHLTREISHDLRPPLLEENSISELIKGVITPYDHLLQITYYEQVIHNKKLDADKKLQVLRITQEVITNIIKHAQASTLSLHIRFSDKGFSFSIQDNGIGFDPTKKGKGLGLKNIELRTQILAGAYRFSRNAQTGMRFTLSFPLEEIV